MEIVNIGYYTQLLCCPLQGLTKHGALMWKCQVLFSSVLLLFWSSATPQLEIWTYVIYWPLVSMLGIIFLYLSKIFEIKLG